MSKKGQKNKKVQVQSQFENFQTKKDIRESLDKLFEQADELNKKQNKSTEDKNPNNRDDIPALLQIFDITADVQENTRKAISIFNQIKLMNEF